MSNALPDTTGKQQGRKMCVNCGRLFIVAFDVTHSKNTLIFQRQKYTLKKRKSTLFSKSVVPQQPLLPSLLVLK